MKDKKPSKLKEKKKSVGKKVNNQVPYHKKPADMSLEKWQIALRRQFGETKSFGIKKINNFNSAFGDYEVFNIETKNTYKVAFRGLNSKMNFCSCLDFKTNRLGTCKHLEAVVNHVKNNYSLYALSKEYEPSYTSVYLSYQNGQEVKIRVGNEYSSEFKQLATQYFDKNNTLIPEKINSFEVFLEQAAKIDDSFRCYKDALNYILDLREYELRKKLSQKYTKEEDFVPLINATLFPYQQEGIRFAFEAGRSLIADEMGLGKTIQAIATAQMLRKERGIEKVLIVCPTTLKYQWQSEIKKFTDANALVIEGNPLIRAEQYKREDFFKVASYHTVVNDLRKICDQNFDLIILDEAQRIKNWKTQIAQAIKKIQTPYCVVLTGTPLENKIEELYSIVQFVNPYKLGPYYWFLDYYQNKDGNGKVIGYQHLDEIHVKLKNLLKRRRKSDVLLQLPERMDKNLFVPMTQEQREIHDEYQDLVARLVSKWRRFGFLSEKDRQSLLIDLNIMRMSCDSTYIIDQKTRNDSKIDELMNILTEYFDGNDEKAVIFSQWERMTRIIAQELDTLGIKYEHLNGSVPSKERKKLFDNFNNDVECRVFLSTDAGSTGVNLQSASLIINMDIPWNPAVLEQRIARIHRLGQKNNVSVINFVSQHTIEHKMLSVLKFKTSLFQGILDNGESTIFLEDSKFNAFMKEVEDIATINEDKQNPEFISKEDIETRSDMPHNDEIFIENEEQPENNEIIPEEPEIIGDDDIKADEGTELIMQGFSFLNNLAKTLQNKESTEKLVKSMVEKDEKTGKTHLKIPVESEEMVTNVFSFIGNLMKGFGK